jgi:hypothetical protein
MDEDRIVTDSELDHLRNQAFEKLKRGPGADLSIFTDEEHAKIDNIINDMYTSKTFQSEEWRGVIMQIEADIARRYKKFDAMAMWLDPIGGLAKYERGLIKKIAVDIGGLSL